MGVKDLWQLLSPIGRRVSIESLEGKVLAIDMSIWITQFIKAMRDDEGKMIRNAHLIGTIRRILRLLYHKIRPVFVFDGETPALKARIMQQRRKVHERHESNRKAAMRKLILTQLEKRIRDSINPQSASAKGTFVSPESIEDSQSAYASAADDWSKKLAAYEPAAMVNDEEEEWESTALVSGKTLDDDGHDAGISRSRREHQGTGGNEIGDNDEDEEQPDWVLPERYDELDVGVLSSLPIYVRKSIVEDARRRERQRSRTMYIPVAEDPMLYSQTQLANFLKMSKLNKKFEAAQKLVEGSTETRRIAAEGNKRYRLVRVEEKLARLTAEEQRNSSSSSIQEFASASAMEALKEWESNDDEVSYEDLEEDDELFEDSERGEYKSHTMDWLNDSEDIETPRRGVHDVEASDNQIDSDDSAESAKIHSRNSGDESPTTGFFLESEMSPVDQSTNDNMQIDSAVGTREIHGSTLETGTKEESKTLSSFYDNLHCADEADSLVEDQIWDEVEWETASNAADQPLRLSSSPPPPPPPPSVEQSGQAESMNIGDDLEDVDVKEEIDWDNVEVVIVDKPSTSDAVVDVSSTLKKEFPSHEFDAIESIEESEVQFDSIPSSVMASSGGGALQRAVATASNLADWAGRVVRRALRDHLPDSNVATATASATVGGKALVKEEVNSADKESENNQSTDPEAILPFYNETYADSEMSTRKALQSSARDAEKMTDEMNEDVLQLVQAFDLPFLIAPFEAEAQCAVLEELNLVDGVITEDSDAFLFGAKHVYRNIFTDQKFVEVYYASDAQQELGLTRSDLISLAFLLGSDYCEGVHGVGIVNAMEILQAFETPEVQTSRSDVGDKDIDQSTDIRLNALERFRDWLHDYDFAAEVRSKLAARRNGTSDAGNRRRPKRKRDSRESGSGEEESESDFVDTQSSKGLGMSDSEQKLLTFDSKHKSARAKWQLPDSFPDRRVATAYWHPQTNRNSEPFSWPMPTKSKIQIFCRNVLGWTDNQIDATVDPVLSRFAVRTAQTRIDSYFRSYTDDQRFAKIASKRLQSAVRSKTSKL